MSATLSFKDRVQWLQSTGDRRVALVDEVLKDWEKIEGRFQKRLQFLFEKFGDRSLKLTMEQFRFEGRFPSGLPDGSEIGVYVFKAFQERIYGTVLEIDGHETFVGVAHEQKKRDRANQATLKKVARIIGEYLT